MSSLFVLWQTARHAGHLARTAAPYHDLGAILAQRPIRLPIPQQAAALQLQGLWRCSSNAHPSLERR